VTEPAVIWPVWIAPVVSLSAVIELARISAADTAPAAIFPEMTLRA
jgi:hypothetical protein